MVPKAFSYARFSSKRQADGHSLERQLQIARDWYLREIAALGLPLDDLKCDDGYSAFRGLHVSKGSLGHFLAEIRAGNVIRGSILICENLDRISRQGPKAARKLIEQIVDAGVDLHIVNISVKLSYGWENDLAKSVLVDSELGRAWKESQYKSDRIGRAWAAKKAKAADGLALTPRVPAWLKSKSVPIPEYAATVVRVFELYVSGYGCNAIVTTLLAEGRKPFFNGGKQGRAWTRNYVLRLLKNRAVIGELQPHKLVDGKRVPDGGPVPDYYPRVVRQSLYEAVRKIISAKTRIPEESKTQYTGGRDTEKNLFSGLVFDDDKKVIMDFQQKEGDRPYLVSRWISGVRANRLRYDTFEGWMLALLPDFDWRTIAGESESPEARAAQKEYDAALSEIDRHKSRIAGLERLIEEGAFSASLFATLDAEKLACSNATAREEKLALELRAARAAATALHAPERLLEAIRAKGDPEQRMRLKAELKRLISKIEVSFADAEMELPAEERTPAAERLDYCLLVYFVNGAFRAAGVKDGKALLAELKVDPEEMRALDKA